eukprot:TRINITY_DN2440_c0_g1_i1.p1 TRINITY_DN2440_c0_g1~~TRINITY_DN2440_c0_g1_i1.p1  ORF type:complete len:637 (-),score=20.72 TRINITY_DN2440_c0_g1_i1:256-2166(-)
MATASAPSIVASAVFTTLVVGAMMTIANVGDSQSDTTQDPTDQSKLFATSTRAKCPSFWSHATSATSRRNGCVDKEESWCKSLTSDCDEDVAFPLAWCILYNPSECGNVTAKGEVVQSVRSFCPKTCGVCTTTPAPTPAATSDACVDKEESWCESLTSDCDEDVAFPLAWCILYTPSECGNVTAKGEVVQSVRSFCPKTCGVCTTTPAPTPALTPVPTFDVCADKDNSWCQAKLANTPSLCASGEVSYSNADGEHTESVLDFCAMSCGVCHSWSAYCSGTGEVVDAEYRLGTASIAVTANCTPVYEFGQNAVSDAVTTCESKYAQRCYTFDVDRDTCFACNTTNLPTSQQNAWTNYCNATGVKSFAMSRDCTQGAFTKNLAVGSKDKAISESIAACNLTGAQACAVFSVDGHGCPDSAGACDLRSRLPACLQVNSNWCWATAVAEIVRFFGYNSTGKVVDTSFLNASRYTDEHCGGVECLVVGMTFHPDAPETCCANESSAGSSTECDKGGVAEDQAAAITNLTGVRYKVVELHSSMANLTQARLNHIFCTVRAPIILNVRWEGSTECDASGHALTLAGTNGHGEYYLHDPEDRADYYQTVTYEQLTHYSTPEANACPYGRAWNAVIPAEEGDEGV